MCEFVRLVKGVDYIQEVQELTRRAESSNIHVPIMTIEEAMLTDPVRQALSLGLNAEKLRCKTQHRILETGRSYETLDELLVAIFGEQENFNSCLERGHTFPCNSPNANCAETQIANPSDTPKSDVTKGNISTAAMPTSKSETDLQKCCERYNSKIKAEDTPSSNEKFASDRKYLEEENRKLKDARLCKVCLDEEVGVVYLPCGHLVTCVQCAPGVNQCPMCRTKIKGFVRTYLS